MTKILHPRPLRGSTAPEPRPTSARFPLSPYPTGWYLACWSHELGPGAVRALDCLGRSFAVFRDSQGAPHVIDAHCPHMGANLAKGGKVCDDTLECPFHGWRFDGSGQCAHTPSSSPNPAKIRIPSHPVIEVNGGVFFFFSLAPGASPEYSLPPLEPFNPLPRGWRRPRFFAHTFRTHIQMIAENGFDVLHFTRFHYAAEPPRLDYRADGPRMTNRVAGEIRAPGLRLDLRIQFDLYGPSFLLVTTTEPMAGKYMLTYLPLDPERCLVRGLVYFPRTNNPLLNLIMPPLLPRIVRRNLLDEANIWEHMTYLAKPRLSREERPTRDLRRWYAQFYEA